MTVLIDTSVWVNIFRDRTGTVAKKVSAIVGDDEIVLSRFTQLELLQGAANESEWFLLDSYLDSQEYLEASAATWGDAARIFYDLRRSGLTVRSSIDCCIAQLAMDFGALLLHEDRDFEKIASITALVQLRP